MFDGLEVALTVLETKQSPETRVIALLHLGEQEQIDVSSQDYPRRLVENQFAADAKFVLFRR